MLLTDLFLYKTREEKTTCLCQGNCYSRHPENLEPRVQESFNNGIGNPHTVQKRDISKILVQAVEFSSSSYELSRKFVLTNRVYCLKGRDGSFGIATSYSLDGPGFEVGWR